MYLKEDTDLFPREGGGCLTAGVSVEGKGAGGVTLCRCSVSPYFQPVLSLSLLGFQDPKSLWVLEGEGESS